jgi:hypothetical protein
MSTRRRLGSAICVACLVLAAAVCPTALAADSLAVFADNSQVALGGTTTLAAHAETSAGYGGGHVELEYKDAGSDCAATAAEDPGTPAGQVLRVPAGQGTVDIGGQMIQLGAGSWRVCGWLVDDLSGAVIAQGSTLVRVSPYRGTLSMSLDRQAGLLQVTLTYASSAPTRLNAAIRRATGPCPASPSGMAKESIFVAGRFVGSDGGLGRGLDPGRLARGHWRVCAWLEGELGTVGPVSKTFAVPRPSRRGARAALR